MINSELTYVCKRMDSEKFEIKLTQFEGPFDLLLFFIERDELNIHDIPIAQITSDFLDYVQQLQALNLEVASEFIIMAATLMRIKAKTLLPRPQLDAEGEEIDPKETLVQKLLLYKQFKEVSLVLKELEAARWQQHRRANIGHDLKQISAHTVHGDELTSFDLYKLMMVYERMMGRYANRSQEVKHTVEKYPYTIEQQKAAIATLLTIDKKLDFTAIARHSENKVQFVYNFLAVLEMLQQELLDIQVGLGFNNFWIQERNST